MGSIETFTVSVDATRTYFLVVDGSVTEYEGCYTLTAGIE